MSGALTLALLAPVTPGRVTARHKATPLPKTPVVGAGELRPQKSCFGGSEEPELTRTELTKARWTRCRRQQQIEAKSESNTKSCGQRPRMHDVNNETAGSIER